MVGEECVDPYLGSMGVGDWLCLVPAPFDSLMLQIC